MSIFNTILQKLGIQKPAAAPAPTQSAAPAVSTSQAPTPVTGAAIAAAHTPPPSTEIPMVDVVSKLDGLAKKSAIPLNWRVSINDLLVVLGMDHSAEAIKELAVELGCPESEMGDSYKRNVWAHKALLQKIAENGGNIPQELLRK